MSKPASHPSTATESIGAFDLERLAALYRRRPAAVADIVAAAYRRIADDGDPALFLALVPREAALARAVELAGLPAEARALLPLYGVPFAVKDNIDVAGMPTTAACPDFAYTAAITAPAVQRVLDAGAILIGKTNLDQFATGLVGVRSPYGVPRNAINPAYVPGGSSSGSATAVAKGIVSFAFGTDTAGSGRVPAAFNNIVGLKPTRGAIGTSGVVPACRSLDCLSIFALTVGDAAAVLAVAAGDDAGDPYGRRAPMAWSPRPQPPAGGFTFGVPRLEQRRFFGNPETPVLFEQALAALRKLGGTAVDIDYAPFAAAADLLYQGPWVAERLAAIKDFFARSPDSLHPVTRRIIGGGADYSAVGAFEGAYRLEALRKQTAPVWAAIDMLVVPSAGTIYRVDEVERDPITLNANLGYYTNFVNFFDLAAIAVPAGFQADGLPFGITLIGPAWHEGRLGGWADAFHRDKALVLGATGHALADAPVRPAAPSGVHPAMPILAVGAHMRGLPLNGQLTALGAKFRAEAETMPDYRLFDLGGTPPRPGLVRSPGAPGAGKVRGEIFDVPIAAVGNFLAQIPPPLGLGTIDLADGTKVKGFLCEAHATVGAKDITAHGGWRAYLQALAETKKA